MINDYLNDIYKTGFSNYLINNINYDNLKLLTKEKNNDKDSNKKISTEEYTKYQNLFLRGLNELTNNRDKAIYSALFMAIVYPNRLHYDWGGGHGEGNNSAYFIGLNPTLGELYNLEDGAELDEDRDGGDGTFTPDERERNYDCSGFVSWTAYNANILDKIIPAPCCQDFMQGLGGLKKVMDNPSTMQVGDYAFVIDDDFAHHIGIIVHKDDKGIIIAHVSGRSNCDGLTLSRIDNNNHLIENSVIANKRSSMEFGKRYFNGYMQVKY